MFLPAEQWYSALPSSFLAISHLEPNIFYARLSLSSSFTGQVCLMMAAAMMSVHDISSFDMEMTSGIACDSYLAVLKGIHAIGIAVV